MGFVGSGKSLPMYASLDSCLFQAGNETLWGSGSWPATGCMKVSPPLCSTGKVVHRRLTLQRTLTTPSSWRGPHKRTTSLAERQKSLVSDAGQWSLPPSWDVGPGLRFKSNKKCKRCLWNIFRARGVGDFFCLQTLLGNKTFWPSCPRTSSGSPGRDANSK